MTIDAGDKKFLTFTEAAMLLPGRPHPNTFYRWARFGVAGKKLPTFRVGGRRYVTVEALEAFIGEVTAAANGDPSPVRTPQQRRREIAAAERRLAAAGI